MNTAGIIICEAFINLSGLEARLGNSIKPNLLTSRKGKVIFLNKATLILADSELATDPFNIENTRTISFVISTATNSYAINVCSSNTLIKSLISLNDERIEDFGEKLTEEQGVEDVYTIVQKALDNTLGLELVNAIKNKNYSNIDLNKLKSHHYDVPKRQYAPKPVPPGRSQNHTSSVSNEYDESTIDNFFDRLTNENENVVSDTIDTMHKENINKPVLSYLLNLAHFHWSLKIRRSALKVIEDCASNSLWDTFITNWDKKYFPKQMYRNRALLNHPDVDASEYLVFAQANRRNYFKVKPKKGDVVYMSSRYNDEAENIFECYNVEIKNLSNRITKLQNIGSANFRNSPNIDWEDTITKLSRLSNLHFLQIAKCGLSSIPKNLVNLKKLKKLIIEEEMISNLPIDLKLEELKSLDIKGSKINSIDFNNFPKLTELWVDGKQSLEKMIFHNLNKEILVTSGRLYSERIK